VVRVEPTGDAVIAGRASPRAAVQLRSDGQVVAQVDADESGQFAILPPPFSAGGHRLQLAARTGGASEVLSDAIGIEVPVTAEAAAPIRAPVSPPSEPSAAAKPLKSAPAAPKPVESARTDAPAAPKTAPTPEAPKAPSPGPAKVAARDAPPAGGRATQPVVSILSVEANGAGRLEAKGVAEPNAIVRLYLNNTYVAEAIAGADGRWSLTVERGMTAGAYAIRADEIDRTSGAVVARAEAPFDYPARTQVATATPSRALTPPETPPAKPIADQAAPSGATAPPPAPKAAQDAKPPVATAATPAPQSAAPPQAAPAPQAAQPAAKNEAPQTSTPAAPTVAGSAPEPPEAARTDLPAKVPSAPAQSAASTEAAVIPPAAPASAPAAAETPAVAVAEPPKPADGANPVVAEIRTTKVVRGDNLWNLSKHFYGYGPHYKVIYEANSSQIRNPRLIYPDQIFVVPPKPAD
jgi:nucleoid-associated protein YgaU